MGAGNIIENNIKSATSQIWNKVPTLADKSWLNFDLKDYNKSFVNLAVAAGVIAVTHSALKMTCQTLKCATSCKKVPTSIQLLDKYGHHSWALIADCRSNEEYAKFLARKGFNLILMGDEQDIQIAKEQSEGIDSGIQIECIPIDWKKDESDLNIYQELTENLKNHDISLLVLPRMMKSRELVPSHLECVQPFAHIYLLTRYFAEKLTWRSYKSAIIFPSYSDSEDISPDNGITKSIIAGVDAFGRIIGHEQRQNFEVVVARGSVENAFAGLGNKRITN